jgi:ubiquinone/menaquinone biosynthesis C-methylase UbiE
VTARRVPRTDSTHYSYSWYADRAIAESFDEKRFGGPIGRVIADAQEAVIAGFLDPLSGKTVLDVGTGTGRAALALARRGARVTGVDASAEMLAVAVRRSQQAGLAVTFAQDDAHALHAEARSFDDAVCLRVLMHASDWRRCLAELCRVARQRIVFDYPALASVAALESYSRRVVKTCGFRVEPYRVFSDAQIKAALAANGFEMTHSHRQFVLPIALHKRVGSPALTARVERAFARTGVTSLVGSPVTVAARRCAS